jgi:hypothetical protein
MYEWLKKRFKSEEAFVGTLRGVIFALFGIVASPPVMALLMAKLGPWGTALIPAVLAYLGGRVTAGQKNPPKE